VFRVLAVVFGLAGSGCVLITDAATRLAEDLVENAAVLEQEGGAERRFSHQPRSWPSGCEADYTVMLQESPQHPRSGGSLLIGCKGEPNFQASGYSYSTASHLNAVRVPQELSADKRAGSPLRVTLRKQGGLIDVVAVE
jgi:hypothetical protein